jgi:hypothetical protein
MKTKEGILKHPTPGFCKRVRNALKKQRLKVRCPVKMVQRARKFLAQQGIQASARAISFPKAFHQRRPHIGTWPEMTPQANMN